LEIGSAIVSVPTVTPLQEGDVALGACQFGKIGR
jgi:hypothetical protein